MKNSTITKILAALAVSIIPLTRSPSTEASSDKYFCQEVKSEYGVYARTERGNMRLMSFKRDFSQDWTASKRCGEVAQRFQAYYDNSLLKFIGEGYVNNQPVLCSVVEKGQPCESNNILVTLPPQTDPMEAARQLMDIRALSRGKTIEVSGKGKLETFVNDRAYYDLELLEELILQQENSDRLIN